MLRVAHDFHALRLQPYFGATALAHSECAPALARLVKFTPSEKRSLVHGDVCPKNVLVGLDGPVLLDAECAWYEDPALVMNARSNLQIAGPGGNDISCRARSGSDDAITTNEARRVL